MNWMSQSRVTMHCKQLIRYSILSTNFVHHARAICNSEIASLFGVADWRRSQWVLRVGSRQSETVNRQE